MFQVPQAEILNRLSLDNPWWETGGIDTRLLDMPRRAYYDAFFKLVFRLEVNRAVVLMGPRRVGKTVMVHHAIQGLINESIDPKKIMYLSLETPLYTGFPLESFVNTFKEIHNHSRNENLYIIFDEIQYLPNWEVHLKSLVDSYPSYKFIATGSAAAALRLKSRESGAGRFTDFLLPPLTFAEYLEFIQRADMMHPDKIDDYKTIYFSDDIRLLNKEFVNYLNYGGYPEAVFSESIQKDQGRFIKSDIIDKVLLRDLPSLYGISDIQELNTLFTSIAYNTGNEVSLEELSKSSGVSKKTIKRYIEYLEAAFLIRVVHRVDKTAKKFKRATAFKVYLTNPSMRAALFGSISGEDLAMGPLTETAIFSQWFHNQSTETLYYARWKSGEVDIVWVDNSELKPEWCVEVKWTDAPCEDFRKIKGLIEFSSIHELRENSLVTTKEKRATANIDDLKIDFVPSAEYAYTLGKNIVNDKS